MKTKHKDILAIDHEHRGPFHVRNSNQFIKEKSGNQVPVVSSSEQEGLTENQKEYRSIEQEYEYNFTALIEIKHKENQMNNHAKK